MYGSIECSLSPPFVAIWFEEVGSESNFSFNDYKKGLKPLSQMKIQLATMSGKSQDDELFWITEQLYNFECCISLWNFRESAS